MGDNRATLPKSERLYGKRLIDKLFTNGLSFVSYPLRVVYLPISDASETNVSVLFNVPKKKIKHAVDRNFIKRRMRESYRLQKHLVTTVLAHRRQLLLVAFLYIDDRKASFATISRAMQKALQTLSEKVS